jgi:hypothetical protein
MGLEGDVALYEMRGCILERRLRNGIDQLGIAIGDVNVDAEHVHGAIR